MNTDIYQNPLITRYASPAMSYLWSPDKKFQTWRLLWLWLAESQQELGLPISDAQLDQMRSHLDNIDWEAARTYENKLRHDVMAHVHTFGDVCPDARKIIHWGATSCFVTDNTDLLLLKESLELVRTRLVSVIQALGSFAAANAELACLGFTHLQPAQPTTVGKRATLWAYDLLLDLHDLDYRLSQLAARGVQGTTGTQASFLKLFDGDHQKVNQLNQRVTAKMGFTQTHPVTGQTYTRKVDAQVLDLLSGIAQSAHKAATDLRLLASRRELEEPFESGQIGSSAMAYKRNPMRSERICGLARFVISLQSSGAMTQSTQWMERTLDDSANRRLTLPQAFLAIDAVLLLYENVASGMRVYPGVIGANLAQEIPFLATENILMAAVAAGGDRQHLHERIRVHSLAAADRLKLEGGDNDLLDRLREEPEFAGLDLGAILDEQKLVGRAPQQVREFVANNIEPLGPAAAPPAADSIRV